MPVRDPQFWVATAIFALALWRLLHGPMAGIVGKRRTRARAVKLTVKGKPVR